MVEVVLSRGVFEFRVCCWSSLSGLSDVGVRGKSHACDSYRGGDALLLSRLGWRHYSVAVFVSTPDSWTVDEAARGGFLRPGTPNGEIKMLDCDYPVVACVEVRIGDKPLGQS